MTPLRLRKRKGSICWWCGSSGLTGEHKFKRTVLERLYGKGNTFFEQGVRLIDYRSGRKPKFLQSAKSTHVQFDKSICSSCNNAKSQPFDEAYDTFISYYLDNEEQIKADRALDYHSVFGTNWKVKRGNLYRYVMKHVGCRLADVGLRPFGSTIKYLNGRERHRHLKIVVQIKPYSLLDLNTLYKGPLILISHALDRRVVTAVCGWFTVKNITFNYIYQRNVVNSSMTQSSKVLIDLVDFTALADISFNIRPSDIATDYGYILEKLEYFPFTAERDEFEIYKYFLCKNI